MRNDLQLNIVLDVISFSANPSRRFAVVVDGLGTPNSRLAHALAGDSLVLKQESKLQASRGGHSYI